jgi:glycosyltransferase involved in cell wall biosynthesis
VRLVIFSPMTTSSAIGRVTGLITRSLADQGHDVDIVRSEDLSHIESEARDVGRRLIRWDDEAAVREVARSADAVLYQVGDNYQLHRGCLEWLPRLPGIVCLHDFALGNLFVWWARSNERSARSVLRSWYGERLPDRDFSIEEMAAIVRNPADPAPMTEWVAAMANGVITHSSWGIARVLQACGGPVRVVPLAYDAPGITPLPSRREETPEDPFRILTVGQVNANKRAESVITAIGQSDQLRGRTEYRLIGKVEPAAAEQLATLARSLDVQLAISGEVGADELREAIGESEVVACLRLPALEAASASTIEAMLYGKAVIVMDTGFYHEIPDEYVVKVSPTAEIPDLRRHLEHLEAHSPERLALGERAGEWAARTFRADSYAQHLAQLAVEVAAAAPALEASRYFAETLVRWGATEPFIPTADIVRPLRIFEA